MHSFLWWGMRGGGGAGERRYPTNVAEVVWLASDRDQL